MGLTVKQAKFAAEYLKDGNASRAYRESYNAGNMSAKTIAEKASRMLKQGNVRARVDAARERVAAKAEITLETITDMLIADRQFAILQENPSACVAATMGLAKVTGHVTEDRKNIKTPLQDFDTEQLKALEAALGQSTGVPGESGRQPASRVTH